MFKLKREFRKQPSQRFNITEWGFSSEERVHIMNSTACSVNSRHEANTKLVLLINFKYLFESISTFNLPFIQ